ncbi:MAG TPA: cyanophycinase [Pirellulales bacterium]|nr:cyanophycinase [Pirellulales bacterium]
MLATNQLKSSLAGIVVTGAIVLAGLGAYLGYTTYLASASWQEEAGPDPAGTLILCGGGSIPTEVFERFVHCAGGRAARIVVIPAYSPTARERRLLVADWRSHGAGSVKVLSCGTRADADAADVKSAFADATGVWISGGSQRYLAEIYVDTEVERQLQALLDRGGVVGGVSAGAAIVTQTMIAGGSEPVLEQRGFDLLPGAVVDQHFLKRNRPQRLLNVLAGHRELVGLGIDEHTAVVIERERGHWSVIGKSYAMVCLPGASGFPRIEILKAGDSTEIELLRDQPGSVVINSASFWDALSAPGATRP